jgi:hypothetical protein
VGDVKTGSQLNRKVRAAFGSAMLILLVIGVSVRGQGCGVPADKIEFVFDSLQQVNGSRARDTVGSQFRLIQAVFPLLRQDG